MAGPFGFPVRPPRRLQRNPILQARDIYDYSFTDWLYGPTALTPDQEPDLYATMPLDSADLGADRGGPRRAYPVRGEVRGPA